MDYRVVPSTTPLPSALVTTKRHTRVEDALAVMGDGVVVGVDGFHATPRGLPRAPPDVCRADRGTGRDVMIGPHPVRANREPGDVVKPMTLRQARRQVEDDLLAGNKNVHTRRAARRLIRNDQSLLYRMHCYMEGRYI